MILPQLSETYIRERLSEWSLGQFADIFLENGFDDIEIIRQINSDDLDTMGIVCYKEKDLILGTLSRIFDNYMSVEDEDTYRRLRREEIRKGVREKVQRTGELPSGRDICVLVVDKLDEDKIQLDPYNFECFIKNGVSSTQRQYRLLRARYAHELELPFGSVTEAMHLIHESNRNLLPPAPVKPPRPRVTPLYDQAGRVCGYRSSDGYATYENQPRCRLHPPSIPEVTQPMTAAQQLEISSQSTGTESPSSVRQNRKKQTFFQRVKQNLFGRPSLDSYLGSSTKTLISDKSSVCSNPKLSFFNKNRSKKEKERFERQRSNSAPDAGHGVMVPSVGYLRASCSAVFRDQECTCHPPPPPLPPHHHLHHLHLETGAVGSSHHSHRVNETLHSNVSLSSSSVSGDSAYSSTILLPRVAGMRPVRYPAQPIVPPAPRQPPAAAAAIEESVQLLPPPPCSCSNCS